MKPRFMAGAFAAAALAMAGVVVAGGALKSGPQEGDNIGGPFHPTNINGAAAGKKNCLV